MPITKVTSDPDALTLTVVGDYPVPVQRLWDAYADPRQLEKFWGPETWPATFTRHDMSAGGRSEYYMTGPDGSRSRGWWRFLAVDPGRRFEVEDGFAHEDGRPNDALPTMRMVFSFERTSGGSRMKHAPQDVFSPLGGERGAGGQREGVWIPIPRAFSRVSRISWLMFFIYRSESRKLSESHNQMIPPVAARTAGMARCRARFAAIALQVRIPALRHEMSPAANNRILSVFFTICAPELGFRQHFVQPLGRAASTRCPRPARSAR